MLGRRNFDWGDVTWGDKAMGRHNLTPCTETIIYNLWSRVARMEIDCNLEKWTNVQLTAFCFNFSIKHEPEATGVSCLVLAIALNIFPPVQYE